MQLRWILTVIMASLAAMASATPTGGGYSKRVLPAIKAPAPPTCNCDISNVVWKSAAKAETFLDIQNGTVVSDQTTAYVLYDAKYIYVAFQCKDSQPDKIQARETVQDSKYQGNGNDTEDNVEVDFDPFQSHQYTDRTMFSLNALGTRSARLGGGRANKVEWKGDWTGSAKRTPDGWMAQMQIPWAALNYPSGRQSTTMNINFTRFQSRTRILSIWSNIGPQGFLDQDGQWTQVETPQGTFQPHLSLLPYLLPGNDNSRPVLHTGLDARYTISPQLTAVGSINPDFSTVESAVPSIQFSRSEIIVPEARPFFLEGRDNFRASNVNLFGNYFLSNRIPEFDVGTKLYGKVTPLDTVGLLHATRFGQRDDLIMNYVHTLSSTSLLGVYLSQKSAVDDNNSVGMVRHNARWGKFTVDTQWSLSSGAAAGGDAKQVVGLYQDKLLFWAFGYFEVSPLYRDADGYIPFTDNRGFLFLTQWNAQWRHGFWRAFNFNLVPQYTWHFDGRPYQPGTNLDINFEARKDWSIDFNTNWDMFDKQTDNTYGLTFVQGVSNRFRQWGMNFQVGKQADRPYAFTGPFFSFRIFRKLDVAYNGALQNFDGVTQQHITTLNYELTPTRSVGGRFVIQNANTNWYLFYRNSGGKGTNLYFVLGDPNAPRFVKQIQMKIVFAL